MGQADRAAVDARRRFFAMRLPRRTRIRPARHARLSESPGRPRGKSVREEIHERPHLGRQVTPARIHGRDRRARRRELRQQRPQATGADLGRHDEIGLEHDAESCDCQRSEHAAIVRADPSSRCGPDGGVPRGPRMSMRSTPADTCTRGTCVAGGRRDVAVRRAPRDTHGEAQQISCVCPRRRATSPGGPAVPMRTARSKPSSTRSVVRSDRSRSNDQLRMAHAELGDGGRQVPHAKRDPAGQPKPALRHDGCGAYHALRLVELGEQLHAALVERLPRFGEREPARRPIQEPRVEVRLELRNLPRHRGGRNRKAFGGAGETAQLDHLCKCG